MLKIFRIITILSLLFISSLLSKDLEKVSLQLKWFKSFQFAGYYMALEKGYYSDVGLDVEIIERDPSKNNVMQVVNGEANYGVSDSALLLYRAKAYPVKLLASIFQHSPLVFISHKESGIISPYEMKGKRISYQKGLDDSAFQAMLQSVGITPSDYTHMPLDFSGKEFIEKKVDVSSAYLSDQPFTLKEKGIEVNIINPLNYGIDFYGDNLFTTQEEIEKNPLRVKAFTQASLKGWKYAINNIDESIKTLQDLYGVQDSTASMQYAAKTLKKLILADVVELGYTSKNRFYRIANVYEMSQSISKSKLHNAVEELIFDPDAKKQFPGYMIYILLGILVVLSMILIRTYIIKKQMDKKIQEITKEALTQKKMIDQHVMVCTTDLNGVILNVNSAYEVFSGYAASELIGQRHSLLRHPEAPKSVYEKMWTTIKKGKPWRGEVFNLNKNRQKVYVDLLINPMYENEKLIGYRSIQQDITDQKQVDKIKKLMDESQKIANIGSWKLDLVHNKLDWSDETFRIFGVNKNELEATYDAFLDAIHPDDRDKVNAAYADSLENKLPYETTHRLLMKDGSIKWVKEQCKTTFDENGNPLLSIGTVHDITEKTEFENQISQEKNFVSAIFENANAIVAVIDSTGTMTRLNNYGEEFTGYTQEEIASKPYFWSRFLNDAVKDKVENIFHEANKGNVISSFQNSWISRDGQERMFEWSNQLVKKDDGSMDYLFSIGIDISDKIQMQEQILKQKNEQEKLLSLFNKGDASLFKWNNDESWSIEYTSENVDLLTGYTNHEFISKQVQYADFICPDDISHVFNEVEQAVEANLDFFQHEPYRIITKDGSIKWVLDTTVTQKNQDNEITHFIGYITDISSIKEQEKKLKESELRWKFAIEGNGDGLWDWNMEDDSVFFSTEWKRMLGFEENEIQGSLEECSSRVHPKQIDQVYSDINAYLDGKTDMYRNEHQVLCKDGSYKWVLDRGIVIKRDENNKPLRMIGTHTDIDIEKKLQKELSQARIDADKANKSKSEFLANMSHEIRTPMTGLLGFVDRLQKSESDTERKKQFQVIRNSGETLLNIINDILDFSKIESGKLEIESAPFGLNETLQISAHSFHQLASAKNINLMNAVNENVPLCAYGDGTRLKQVIFNLMNNAIKFTSPGGNITLQARFNEENSVLHIAVIDTGIGIAKGNLEKIFQAFSQEDISTTRKFGGTGLGLSISSSFIKLMSGELKVESEVGQGSKFYFNIPIKTCLETDIKDNDEIPEVSDDLLNFKGNVLIVEDNKTNQMLLSMILDDHDVNYDIASDGAEGVLMNKLNTYEMILMDENMPIMNGIEATKNIRERELETGNHIPIIAVTANALKSDRERFLDIGMDDYISKPYTEEDIVRVLQKYLG